MKKFIALIYLLFLASTSWAQTHQVTGTITSSEDNEPIPGVSVMIKGSQQGTITDLQGKYSIEVNDNGTLIYSFIGMQTKVLKVSGKDQIDVVMQNSMIGVDEVVVVGYGTQKKSDLTGSVVTVKAEDINTLPSSGIADAITGKVAGVYVSSSSGRPGSTPVVRIRGVGTLNNSAPIYVVDGFIIDNIDFLSPNDISSIEVLKDASATAIYGSRGANGVIMVTTKQGVKGKTTIDLTTQYSLSQVANQIEMVNGENYAQLMNEAYENNGGTGPYNNPSLFGEGTNWFNEIYKVAPIHNYSLSARGGNDNVLFNISGTYYQQDGVIEKTDYKRFTLRANNSYKLGDHINLGHNLTFIRRESTDGPNITQTAYRAPSIDVPYNEDGSFAPVNAAANPLATTYYSNANSEQNKIVGNFYGDLTFGDFSFRSSYGFELYDTYGKSFRPVYFVSVKQKNDNSSIHKSNSRSRNWIWDNTLNYSKKLNNHNISVLAGITMQDNYWENLGGTRYDLPSEVEELWFLNVGSVDTQSNYNGASSYSYLSYLGRANYSYLDKYLLTATYRIDGSSKFGKNSRYAYFPSVALGWRLTEESFMQNISFLSNLKLRGSWGIIGNDKIGAYSQYTSLQSNFVAIFGPDEAINLGTTIESLANSGIKWETTTQTNFGFESGFLDNRLGLEIDYYHRQTDDILLAVPIPDYIGSKGNPMMNAASVLNKGWDVSLRWNDVKGDFQYSINANFSTIYNEVLALAESKAFIQGGNVGGGKNVTRTEVGHSIGAFYGYVVDGIYQNQQELNDYPTIGAEGVGDLRYKDINGRDADGNLTGQPDGVIDIDDRTYIGSPIPDFIYGANINMGYKNFGLSVDLQGVYGNEIFNGKKANRFDAYNYEATYLDRWTGEGTSNSEPRITFGGHNFLPSEYFIEDGSFLRIRNLQLSYSFKSMLANTPKIQDIMVYVSGTNLFTFTKYSGSNPEIAASSVIASGIDMSVYPTLTIYSFGLNVKF